MGSKYKDSNTWELVVDSIERRLAGWKIKFLSKRGRLTLIKSTLTNLPIYFLSALTIPVKVTRRVEAIRCRFLWGDEEDKSRFHLVKWDDVEKLIYQGGLRIKSLVEMNVALQGKWLWAILRKGMIYEKKSLRPDGVMLLVRLCMGE